MACCFRFVNKTIRGGLPHLINYDFVYIVKTNISLRFKENIIIFFYYYFNCWFTRSNSEIHLKTSVRHPAFSTNSKKNETKVKLCTSSKILKHFEI
jgi:hypothetical protein